MKLYRTVCKHEAVEVVDRLGNSIEIGDTIESKSGVSFKVARVLLDLDGIPVVYRNDGYFFSADEVEKVIPDSLDKIKMDIRRMCEKQGSGECAYFNKGESGECKRCPAYGGSCYGTVALDIARRVNALGIEVSR